METPGEEFQIFPKIWEERLLISLHIFGGNLLPERKHTIGLISKCIHLIGSSATHLNPGLQSRAAAQTPCLCKRFWRRPILTRRVGEKKSGGKRFKKSENPIFVCSGSSDPFSGLRRTPLRSVPVGDGPSRDLESGRVIGCPRENWPLIGWGRVA